MKIALAKSYNLAAVHLLEQVGIQAGAQMVRRFGITNPMAPSLPSALGASEASLLEMVSAYSSFPNKGIRMIPHLVRKVYSRDGSLLEEWDNQSSKVMNEYVALTMVEMMRGVTAPGGTAPGASAGGNPVAGKTGTVNDHTDVWFIGYTPTYVTGVWMGNPVKKENLGSYMTGGHGALPYFNAYMNAFMKGKPIEKFDEPPPIPADIKALIARNKREELEKLEEAEAAGRKTGVTFDPGPKPTPDPNFTVPGGDTDPDMPAPPPLGGKEKPPANPRVVVEDPVKPVPTPKRVENQPNVEGTKRKGKKGDG
jgi:penicillin-binding protein 1A